MDLREMAVQRMKKLTAGVEEINRMVENAITSGKFEFEFSYPPAVNPPKHFVVRVFGRNLTAYLKPPFIGGYTSVLNVNEAFVFASEWQAERVAAYYRRVYIGTDIAFDVVPVTITASL